MERRGAPMSTACQPVSALVGRGGSRSLQTKSSGFPAPQSVASVANFPRSDIHHLGGISTLPVSVGYRAFSPGPWTNLPHRLRFSYFQPCFSFTNKCSSSKTSAKHRPQDEFKNLNFCNDLLLTAEQLCPFIYCYSIGN